MIQIALSAIIITFIGSAIWFIFGGRLEALNFALASISSLIVVYASYFGYAKLVKNSNVDVIEEENEDDEDEKQDHKSVLSQTFKGWLFPLRLVAYGVLTLSFLALSAKNILMLTPFLVGLGVAPFSAMIGVYFLRK